MPERAAGVPLRSAGERRLDGRVASPGLGAGPAHAWRPPPSPAAAAAGHVAGGHAVGGPAAGAAGAAAAARAAPAAERARLQAAVARAQEEIGRLAASVPGAGAEVLQFQAALLQDDTLLEPAHAAISAGTAAEAAWAAALDAEIAGYEDSGDADFAARASDLRDLRWRVLQVLQGGACATVPPGAVLFADDLPPSAFLGHDWTQGGAIVLAAGSSASHLAMLARSRGVPMLVGTQVDLATVAGDALVDAEQGIAWLQAAAATREAFQVRAQRARRQQAAAADGLLAPARTRDGTVVQVLLNVTDVRELDELPPAACDGIGLVRSEFLFGGDRLPDEETQYRAYRRIVDWAQGRPATIRTLDAGGDKPIAGLGPAGEANPALGLRGVRLSLAYPEVLRVQLRALLRAAVHGPLRIMVPMVTVPAELERVRALLEDELAALAAAGVPVRRPPLGMMVEVPAAALTVELFDAAFFSIGSNDLAQYTTAAARDLGGLAELVRPLHPAVLELVGRVVARCSARGREVSLCGDAAADPALVGVLLACGLRALSVAPAALATTKAAVRGVELARP